MASDKSQIKTTNPIINTVLVFSVGLSTLEISQLLFGSSQVAALTSLQFNQVFESMYRSMLLSADSLSAFWAVLVAWGISGMVAGVRAKHGLLAVFAGFFGTILGSGLLLVTHFSNQSAVTISGEFIIGVLASTLITCIAGYATGTATKPKKTTPKAKRTRKAWDSSKAKEVWTCNKCKKSIPPGAFTCPSCGEPVIE
jgi:hypothetical protein